ncbi:hypothetical protein [Streptomyces flaveolus]|uniref:hypothetical protein n=1 Tax=Streptomyces flaveolus TaxID=67297 RepID=UPI00166FA6C5|nr:hypothetical protein [Streptomyces flaveolus]
MSGTRHAPHLAIQSGPGSRAMARDRQRLWHTAGEPYRRAVADLVRNGLPGVRGLDADLPYERLCAAADLAAVRLCLARWEPGAQRDPRDDGTPDRRALARCVTSGLRRLLPYQGAAAAPDEALDRYRENRSFTEEGLWAVSTAAGLGPDGGVLVHSLTGRHTAPLDPRSPHRLLFLPGTRFRVLRVTSGDRPVALVRELRPDEPAVYAHPDAAPPGVAARDEDAAAALDRMLEAPAQTPRARAGKP